VANNRSVKLSIFFDGIAFAWYVVIRITKTRSHVYLVRLCEKVTVCNSTVARCDFNI